MKKIVIPLLLLLAAAGAWLWRERETPKPGGALTLYGNIDIRQVQLSFRVGGRLMEALVDEGDAVGPGLVVARLDPVPYADALRSAEAQRDSASAALDKAVNGPRPAEIAQARANVEALQADLVIAEQTYKRYAELVKSSAIPRETYDQAVATRDAAAGRLQAGRDSLQLLEEGTRQEDIEAARAELRAAEAAVSSARTSLADTELAAPSQGMAISRVCEPGAIVAAGSTVFVVSLDAPVWARAYIAEPHLGRVRPGLAVEVFTDTRPDAPYRGVVGFVSPTAEFTPKSVETPELRTDLVYRLRIVIAEPGGGLRQGMPVTVRIPPAGE